VAKRRKEPRWLTRLAVDAVHNDQLREHGGLPGVRDEHALESALARPQQRWHYAPDADLEALAAAYAFGLVRNHPYQDGNKRIGFLAMVTFLGINGLDFDATEQDVVARMLMLAAGNLSEDHFADWIRSPCRNETIRQSSATRQSRIRHRQ
jgi:death-on-curing protein